MVSLKKSVTIILMILCINVNNPCSATDEHKVIFKYMQEDRILREKADTYKSRCVKGVRSLCEGQENGCNSDIKLYVKTIVEKIVFGAIQYNGSPYFGVFEMNDEQILSYAKSFINYVWDKIERTATFQIPKDYCKYYTSTFPGVSKHDCLELMDDNNFYDLNTPVRYYDTLKMMYFELTIRKLKHRGDEQKNAALILAYLQHHLDNIEIKDPMLLSKENNIAELYCQKQMCVYEINSVFDEHKEDGSAILNKINVFKKGTSIDPHRNYITTALKFISTDMVHFPIAKMFIACEYTAIDTSKGKLVMPEVFCGNLKGIRSSTSECLKEFKTDALGGTINEVLENIYFNYSIRVIGYYANHAHYLKLYTEEISKNYEISSVKYGYSPEEFCEFIKLT